MSARVDPVALATLRAVVEEGTFERGAARLHVTPSAVSQRIRALEHALGQVLVGRTAPVRPTAAGEVLLRLGGHWDLLLGEAMAELLPGESGRPAPCVPVVVNADSLATWILPGFARARERLDITLDLIREDEQHAPDLVRRGVALAAVCSRPGPVVGCRAVPLGELRYVAVCTPDFHERWFAGSPGPTAAGEIAPMIRFDRKDRMQHDVARRWHGEGTAEVEASPATFVPSTVEHAAAVRLGMGWGMVPERWVEDDLASGSLVTVGPEPVHEVPLSWLVWKLPSRTLEVLTECVVEVARETLGGPKGGRMGRS